MILLLLITEIILLIKRTANVTFMEKGLSLRIILEKVNVATCLKSNIKKIMYNRVGTVIKYKMYNGLVSDHVNIQYKHDLETILENKNV